MTPSGPPVKPQAEARPEYGPSVAPTGDTAREPCAICGIPSDDLNGEGECPACVDERLDEEAVENDE